MVSFFEKLKKGMGVEAPVEGEKVEKVEEVKEKPTKAKKISVKNQKEKKKSPEPEIKEKENQVEKIEKEEPVFIETKEKWPEQEGQLAIDVYQTETVLVIQSAIAGVKPEDLDISMERDIITIRGNREKPLKEKEDYFTQECYWGPFSREVILPVEIDPNRAEATMKDGILTIRIPKLLKEKQRRIKIRI